MNPRGAEDEYMVALEDSMIVRVDIIGPSTLIIFSNGEIVPLATQTLKRAALRAACFSSLNEQDHRIVH